MKTCTVMDVREIDAAGTITKADFVCISLVPDDHVIPPPSNLKVGDRIHVLGQPLTLS